MFFFFKSPLCNARGWGPGPWGRRPCSLSSQPRPQAQLNSPRNHRRDGASHVCRFRRGLNRLNSASRPQGDLSSCGDTKWVTDHTLPDLDWWLGVKEA